MCFMLGAIYRYVIRNRHYSIEGFAVPMVHGLFKRADKRSGMQSAQQAQILEGWASRSRDPFGILSLFVADSV
jgi:hypothetical protein